MPQERADFRAGQICAVLANIHRTAESKVFEASDFIPVLPDEEEEKQAEPVVDLNEISKAIERMLGRKE